MKDRFVLYIVTTLVRLNSFSLKTNRLLFMKGTFKTKPLSYLMFVSGIFTLKENRLYCSKQTHNVSTVHNGTETLSFLGPKIWLIFPEDIRESDSLIEFTKIKSNGGNLKVAHADCVRSPSKTSVLLDRYGKRRAVLNVNNFCLFLCLIVYLIL